MARTSSRLMHVDLPHIVATTDPNHVGMTTIFIGGQSERNIGIHRAVDSRHSILNGEITAIQEYGRCEAVFT